MDELGKEFGPAGADHLQDRGDKGRDAEEDTHQRHDPERHDLKLKDRNYLTIRLEIP